jgi:hypothetical protein
MTEYLIRSTPGCYRSGVRAEPVPSPASGDTARVRIAIDARPASDAEPTGVGHYTRRMLSHLPAAMPADELVAWHLLAGGSELPRAQNLTEHVSRIPGVLGPVWRRLELPRLERIVRFDALLATNFLPPPTRSDAVVLVVHDVAFEVMPEAGPEFGERWRRRFDGWLRRSAGVIVPSASTKADLLRSHTGRTGSRRPRRRRPNAFARGSALEGRSRSSWAGSSRGRTSARSSRRSREWPTRTGGS